MQLVSNKTILVFALISSFLVLQSKAQTAKWDSLYRPAKYQELIQKFKEDPIKKTDYVFLGNSITAGADWNALLNIGNAKQRGISGDISFGVLERLQEVIDGKPRKMFVLIGINDISRNIPDSLILNNYRKIVARTRKGSCKTHIYFYTLLPVNSSFQKFKNHYGKDEHILFVNEQIRKMAAKKVTIIDLYPNFLDKENKLRAELTKDGLHLIAAGYQVWAEVLKTGGYLK